MKESIFLPINSIEGRITCRADEKEGHKDGFEESKEPAKKSALPIRTTVDL